MPQSLVQNYLHIIFSTKNRAPFLRDKTLREKTHAYLVGACKNLDSPSLCVGGPADHVHILCSLGKGKSVSDLVRDLKRESSKWVKEQGAGLKKFFWQSGFGAFSLSPGHVAALKQYIAGQEEHHKKETFREEFLRFLKKYSVAYDERYVWD